MSWKIRLKWYFRAIWNYPKGVICSWCWRPNFFYDDIGWFCIFLDSTAHTYKGGA